MYETSHLPSYDGMPIIHALLHDLLHRYFLYSYSNPCITFTHLGAAIRLCYVVL